MAILRPQRDAIESLLPKQLKGANHPCNPKMSGPFDFEIIDPATREVTGTLELLGISRSNTGPGFKELNVAVFGLTDVPQRKEIDLESLFDSAFFVLLSDAPQKERNSCSREQVEALEPDSVTHFGSTTRYAFTRTGKVASYPKLVTD